MARLSKPVGALLGAGLAAFAGGAAIKAAGHRGRARHDAHLDRLAKRPDAVHHRLPTGDGGELHVVETGSGRPIVLMHGVTLQWWVWSPVVNLLRDRARVFVWDMRGHGESRAGSDGVTLEATADDLVLLLEHFDLEGAILVGHSMGGMTIGHFVRDHPGMLGSRAGARVAAVMFVATSASALSRRISRGTLTTLYGAAGLALVHGLKRPTPRYPWPDTDLSAALIRTVFGERVTGDMIEAVRTMLVEMPTRSMVEAGNTIAAHEVRDDLGPLVESSVPTVVIVGDHDRITPPGHAKEIVECVPGATLVVLPGVGHQIMQEAPDELVAAIDDLAARVD